MICLGPMGAVVLERLDTCDAVHAVSVRSEKPISPAIESVVAHYGPLTSKQQQRPSSQLPSWQRDPVSPQERWKEDRLPW